MSIDLRPSQVITLAALGWSHARIAAATGVSLADVRAWLLAAGATWSPGSVAASRGAS